MPFIVIHSSQNIEKTNYYKVLLLWENLSDNIFYSIKSILYPIPTSKMGYILFLL